MEVDAAGNVYVADGSHTVRMITPGGMVTTLAGAVSTAGSSDGIGSGAKFYSLNDVAVDGNGALYVTDVNNYRISRGTSFPLKIDSGSLAVSSGSIRMRLSGPPGSNVVVESSAVLNGWTSIQTNTLPLSGYGTNLSLPLGTNQNQFFRTRLSP